MINYQGLLQPDLSLVSGIRARNEAQLAELASIVEFARKRNVTDKWVDELQHAIGSYTPQSKKSAVRTKLRIFTKRMLARGLGYVGLRRPIKAAMHRVYEANAASVKLLR